MKKSVNFFEQNVFIYLRDTRDGEHSMTFGNFSTNSIKTFNNFTKTTPTENKPKPFSFGNMSNNTNSISPFGSLGSTNPVKNQPFSFGNITNNQPAEATSNNTISIEQKEAAKANFINEFNNNFHTLNIEHQEIASEFIMNSQSKGIDTDSKEFKSLPREVQNFIHTSLHTITGVKTKDIPNGKSVKLEPVEELKD